MLSRRELLNAPVRVAGTAFLFRTSGDAFPKRKAVQAWSLHAPVLQEGQVNGFWLLRRLAMIGVSPEGTDLGFATRNNLPPDASNCTYAGFRFVRTAK